MMITVAAAGDLGVVPRVRLPTARFGPSRWNRQGGLMAVTCAPVLSRWQHEVRGRLQLIENINWIYEKSPTAVFVTRDVSEYLVVYKRM